VWWRSWATSPRFGTATVHPEFGPGVSSDLQGARISRSGTLQLLRSPFAFRLRRCRIPEDAPRTPFLGSSMSTQTHRSGCEPSSTARPGRSSGRGPHDRSCAFTRPVRRRTCERTQMSAGETVRGPHVRDWPCYSSRRLGETRGGFSGLSLVKRQWCEHGVWPVPYGPHGARVQRSTQRPAGAFDVVLMAGVWQGRSLA
jgi:hypothetical protein